jgi:hypothetical protein
VKHNDLAVELQTCKKSNKLAKRATKQNEKKWEAAQLASHYLLLCIPV